MIYSCPGSYPSRCMNHSNYGYFYFILLFHHSNSKIGHIFSQFVKQDLIASTAIGFFVGGKFPMAVEEADETEQFSKGMFWKRLIIISQFIIIIMWKLTNFTICLNCLNATHSCFAEDPQSYQTCCHTSLATFMFHILYIYCILKKQARHIQRINPRKKILDSIKSNSSSS